MQSPKIVQIELLHACCPQLVRRSSNASTSSASSGFVASIWPPTLGFGLIDEFILQQFEDLMAIATFTVTF